MLLYFLPTPCLALHSSCLFLALCYHKLLFMLLLFYVCFALLVVPCFKCVVAGCCLFWLLLFSIQFAILQVVVRLGFYYSLPTLHCYCSFSPSLLLFIVHLVDVVYLVLLLFTFGCCYLLLVIIVHLVLLMFTPCFVLLLLVQVLTSPSFVLLLFIICLVLLLLVPRLVLILLLIGVLYCPPSCHV